MHSLHPLRCGAYRDCLRPPCDRRQDPELIEVIGVRKPSLTGNAFVTAVKRPGPVRIDIHSLPPLDLRGTRRNTWGAQTERSDRNLKTQSQRHPMPIPPQTARSSRLRSLDRDADFSKSRYLTSRGSSTKNSTLFLESMARATILYAVEAQRDRPRTRGVEPWRQRQEQAILKSMARAILRS
jgi:hypothetical protein